MEPKALPSYRCHKRVQAVKIKEVSLHDPEGSNPPVDFAGGFFIHDLPDHGPIPFDAAFWEKHKPKAGDYLVIYEDGYRSISPGKAFEEGYTLEASGLNFGLALEALKQGRCIARKGWNGKGMFLFLLTGGRVPKTAIHDPKLREIIDAQVEGDSFEALPSIRMWTTNSEGRRAVLTGWLASQTDMLSDDWEILT